MPDACSPSLPASLTPGECMLDAIQTPRDACTVYTSILYPCTYVLLELGLNQKIVLPADLKTM